MRTIKRHALWSRRGVFGIFLGFEMGTRSRGLVDGRQLKLRASCIPVCSNYFYCYFVIYSFSIQLIIAKTSWNTRKAHSHMWVFFVWFRCWQFASHTQAHIRLHCLGYLTEVVLQAAAPTARSIYVYRQVLNVVLRATIYSLPQIQRSGAVLSDKHKAHIYQNYNHICESLIRTCLASRFSFCIFIVARGVPFHKWWHKFPFTGPAIWLK